jgi:hypothetical protein
MNVHAALKGMTLGWAETDFVILDGEKSVGGIYGDTIIGEVKWHWSINTSPFPAPQPNNGYSNSLEEAKQAFKERYQQMRAAGVQFG